VYLEQKAKVKMVQLLNVLSVEEVCFSQGVVRQRVYHAFQEHTNLPMVKIVVFHVHLVMKPRKQVPHLAMNVGREGLQLY
jgi:hypothetical protein